jgi:hypothetical protein
LQARQARSRQGAEDSSLVQAWGKGGEIMAKMKVIMPKNFEKKISKLGEATERVIQECLVAGAEPLVDSIRAELEGVVGKGNKEENRSTGELVDALGQAPPMRKMDGTIDVKIGFFEPRSDGNVNAKIANILEYGKKGQPARPFLKRGAKKAKKKSLDAMQKKFDEIVSKL